MIHVAKPMVGDEEINAVINVLKSGNFTSGAEVAAFEKEFAEYIGVKHAVSCNSGTAALQLAMQALNIKGKEVVVPPMSFFATVSSVIMSGNTPVFSDVDERCNLDPENLEIYINGTAEAIIPVHFYGHPCQIDKIMEIAKRHNLFVIEDCAQAHGAEVNGRKVGSIGHIGCFSFFATKNMTTIEGGMITTNSDEVAREVKILRSHGMIDRNTHLRIGYNYRLNEVSGAMGRVQLRKLDELNKKRIEISYDLMNGIEPKEWFKLYIPEKNVKDVFFWFPIFCDYPGKFSSYLEENGIGYRFRYNKPLYDQPCLNSNYSFNFRERAENFSGKMFGLPNYPGLTKYQVNKVIDVVNNFNPL